MQPFDIERRGNKNGSSAVPKSPKNVEALSGGAVPELSVIIPTYNRRDTLSACLVALSGQTLSARNFEVVVVDDGSTDGTQDFCRRLSLPFRLQYIRQTNAGAGMARRTGVECASGRYLACFNDDTIASPGLLSEHLQVHQSHPQAKWAVLGDFCYPDGASERALTHFLNSHPLLFPQPALESGRDYGWTHFVTCNLSIRRDAVISAGSFDSAFRVAEDSEIGIRLEQQGYRVYYHAPARARHDHLPFSMQDLVRKARNYGSAALALFRKHPQMLRDGKGLFGRADELAASRIRRFLDGNRAEVKVAHRALEQFDNVDFRPYFAIGPRGNSAADKVVDLFAQAVPRIYEFYLLESFLEAWIAEQSRPPARQTFELPSPREAIL